MIFCLSLVFFRTAFVLFCMFHIMSIMFSLFSSLYLQTCPSTSTSRRCLWPHSGLPHPNALCIRYACIFTFTTLLHSSWSKAHNGFLGAFKAKPWFIMVSRFSRATSALHAPRLPFFPLQMMPGTSRWTSPSRVQFPPCWAAPSPSHARYLSPPCLPPLPPPPPPQLPPLLHLGSSGLWCPAEWGRRSWWRGMKEWRWTRRTRTAPG